MRQRFWLTIQLAVFWFLRPAPALACAVCGLGQNDESATAFYRGTILLSLMPLSMVGGIIFYLYRKTRAPAAPEPPLDQGR
jgi:hypothetical protein